jgi:hypothetical protein
MRFPVLKTGALAQYPATRTLEYKTDVIEFTDGTEQRYRQRGARVNRWVVRLELLDETEMSRLAEFFNAAAGRAGTFEFKDPWTGAVHTNCSLEIDELTAELAGEMRVGTALVIRKNVAA